MIKFFRLLPLVLLMASCSTTQDVVQEGLFQKRKYLNKGWFVDKPVKHPAEEKALVQAGSSRSEEGAYLRPVELMLIPDEQQEEPELEELTLQSVLSANKGAGQEQVVHHGSIASNAFYGTVRPVLSSLPLSTRSAPYRDLDGLLLLMTTGLAILLPTALAIAGLGVKQDRLQDKSSITAYVSMVIGVAALVALAML